MIELPIWAIIVVIGALYIIAICYGQYVRNMQNWSDERFAEEIKSKGIGKIENWVMQETWRRVSRLVDEARPTIDAVAAKCREEALVEFSKKYTAEAFEAELQSVIQQELKQSIQNKLLR